MQNLIAKVKQYCPVNRQETKDRLIMLDWLESGRNILTRDNETAHLTASAWIVSPDRRKTLMVYHNIYQSWSWLGGHADGNPDLLQVARKEVCEESGLQSIQIISEDIFSLEILCVNGHEKNGRYVPSHLHLNITYLFEADPAAPLQFNPDENSGVQWILTDQVSQKSSEPWFVERIYSKLIQKTAALG